MTQTNRGHIAVLLTNIFFAGNYSVIKFISPLPIGPYALNILRVGVSIILFWMVWLFGRTSAGFEKKDIGRFLLCGLFGIALNQTLFIKGLTLTSTIHASLLILITPVLVSAFALWVLKEKFTSTKAAGLFLAISGAAFLIAQRDNGAAANSYVFGDLLILLNAISYSIYFILVKPLTLRYNPLHVIRWVFTIGFFMVLPLGWQQVQSIEWSSFQWYHFAGLFSVSVTGTFLAYYFNAYGIKTIGASNTGTYIYTQPFFVVLIATMFLNEVLTWQKILSGCLIITGVYLVSLKNSNAREVQPG